MVRYSKPYSKPKRPQWKTKTEPSSSLQPIYEYGTILDNLTTNHDFGREDHFQY